MKGMMTRYSTVTSYVRASVERALAMMARRPSLVGADELARLGSLAFAGPDGDVIQCAVDHLAGRAAFVALGMEPNARAADLELDLAVDRQLLDAGLPIEVVKSLRRYADQYAGVTLGREAHARSGNGTERGARSGAHRRGIPITEYCGVWEEGAVYGAGAMVTDRGQLWFAQAESTTGRPGASHDWKLMHKSLEKAGR